jgi:hypothetical protein
MCHKEARRLSQALTLRYDKVLFILAEQRHLSARDVVAGRHDLQFPSLIAPAMMGEVTLSRFA